MNTKRMKLLVYFLVVAIGMSLGFPTASVSAASNEITNPVEKQLIELINKYGKENIIFEDGIVLNENESITIPSTYGEELIEWFSINADIADVNEENSLLGISGGTTFILGKVGSKYIIHEVYVTRNKPQQTTLNRMSDFAPMTYAAAPKKTQYVVYIDAGHGGYDSGAVGNGLQEKDLTLSISLKLQRYLQDNGVKVVMSRTNDTYLSLEQRCDGSNAANADAFISVHINSNKGTPATGIETWYYKGVDLGLTKSIHNNVIASTGANNRGVKQEIWYVLNNTNAAASLLECGFINNPSDANKLRTDSYQDTLAKSSGKGILEYLENNIKLDVPDPIASQRIFGLDRFETSRKIFNSGWSNAENAILVSGMNYADALCAAPLAAKVNAPILLTENKSINAQNDLVNLLKNKGVKNVYIIGGGTVLQPNMENELSGHGITAKRLGGLDRFETSILVAKELGSTSGQAMVANGMSFPDSLSISTIAAQKQIPIILTINNNLPASVENYIREAKIAKTFVIGGETVVNSSVTAKLPSVERLGGSERYETNQIIFERFKGELVLNEVYLASATNFPDALSASAISSKNKSFVILTHPTAAQSRTKVIINDNRSEIKKVNVIGGEVVISDAVLRALGIRP